MPLWPDAGDPGNPRMKSVRLKFVCRQAAHLRASRNWTSNSVENVQYAFRQPKALPKGSDDSPKGAERMPKWNPGGTRAPQRHPKGQADLFLSLVKSVDIYIYIYIYLCTSPSLSFSVSLSLYIFFSISCTFKGFVASLVILAPGKSRGV